MVKHKVTAVSPANIAFIKFWGKKDPKLNIPFNNSISMNLSKCLTETTVELSKRYKKDRVFIDGSEVGEEKKDRVVNILDIVRRKSKLNYKAKVFSRNSFPSDSGIASSASGFSALALAASQAAGLRLSQKELSILARLGSGSACRSIVDGFAEWKKGGNSLSSYAVKIIPENYWDLRDIVVVVAKEKKKVSTTEGHELAISSPYFKARLKTLDSRISEIRQTLIMKNFENFGELLEEEAISFHTVVMTCRPPIFYWNKGTIEVISNLLKWREKGLKGYFTMDAGANVHVICLAKDATRLNVRLKKLPEVLFTIVNKPAIGTRLINQHLF